MRLHDEHVRTTNRFIDATVNLSVGEFAQVGFGQFNAELVGHIHRQRGVTPPRHDYEAAFGEGLHGASVQANERA